MKSATVRERRYNFGGRFCETPWRLTQTPYRLPPVIRGMPFRNRNENPAAGRANFSPGGQCSFHGGAVVFRIDNFRGKINRTTRRRRPQKLNRIFGGDRARRVILLRLFHQMISRGPITVAIEQCADNPAAQDTRESFVFFLGNKFGNNFIALGKTANAQTVGIRRAASKAGVARRVFFLKRLRSVHLSDRPYRRS